LADPEYGQQTHFIKITYTYGETLDAENVRVTLDGTVLFDPLKAGQTACEEPGSYDGDGTDQFRWSTQSIKIGDLLILEDDTDAASTPGEKFSEGQTIRDVWYSSNSSRPRSTAALRSAASSSVRRLAFVRQSESSSWRRRSSVSLKFSSPRLCAFSRS
jgi:hypothetical protein